MGAGTYARTSADTLGDGPLLYGVLLLRFAAGLLRRLSTVDSSGGILPRLSFGGALADVGFVGGLAEVLWIVIASVFLIRRTADRAQESSDARGPLGERRRTLCALRGAQRSPAHATSDAAGPVSPR